MIDLNYCDGDPKKLRTQLLLLHDGANGSSPRLSYKHKYQRKLIFDKFGMCMNFVILSFIAPERALNFIPGLRKSS